MKTFEMLVALVLRKRRDVLVLRKTSEATRRVTLNTHQRTITKKGVIIMHEASFKLKVTY